MHELWTDPGTLILASLAGGSKHGYGIQQDVRATADILLGAGTLYGALGRLESKGHIRPLEGDGRRRPYEITETGSAALVERLSHMNKLVSVSAARLNVRFA